MPERTHEHESKSPTSSAPKALRAHTPQRAPSGGYFPDAGPAQRETFDQILVRLHRSVARFNHETFGDPLPDDEPETTARAGFAGAGGPVPHRAAMERSFGADFGDVRAHTGPAAREACTALGADAYALGSEVAFKCAAPSPALVAHELTHVVQQRGGAGQVARKAGSVASDEAEADRVEAAVAGGRAASDALVGGGGGQGLRLSEDEAPEPPSDALPDGVMALHTVAERETLGSIAQAYYGTPREYVALVTANGIADPNVIEEGTRLKIPEPGRAADVAALPLDAPASEAPASEPAADPVVSVIEQAEQVVSGALDALWEACEDLGAAATQIGELLSGETETEGVVSDEVLEEVVVVDGPVEEQAPADAGPIDPNNHQSRETFVRSTVKEIACTTALIDALYRHFPKEDQVIGGHLNDNEQFWKVNFHWEWMLWIIDEACKLGPTPEHEATLRDIQATLRTNPPSPTTGFIADQTMTLADASSSELVLARWSLMAGEKKRLEAVWQASGLPEKAGKNPTTKNLYLASAPVAKPGTSKHGTGLALDIAGDNGRIATIARALGATLVFDEASHVHVEFLDGVKG